MKQLDTVSVRWGLLLALLPMLMGIYLGIHFGKDEDEIKDYLHAKASAAAVFEGNPKKIDAAAGGAWKYLKRAHEHYQGLGAMALALVLAVSASWLKPVLKGVVSVGIGLGATLYPTFWYLVAWKVAGMEKHAAKESLAFMAQAGAGLFALSFLAVLFVWLAYAIWKDDLPGFLSALKE